MGKVEGGSGKAEFGSRKDLTEGMAHRAGRMVLDGARLSAQGTRHMAYCAVRVAGLGHRA